MPEGSTERVAGAVEVQEARTDAHTSAPVAEELPGLDTAAWAAAPWEDMVEHCKARTQKEPRDFQVKVGENAAWKRVDTLLKAPTNAGKTLAQFMGLFLSPGSRRAVAFMPLNALEQMQIKLEKWGLRVIVLNHETKTPALMKRIETKDFDALLTSPEQIELGLADIMSKPGWGNDVYFVVDEAHCIPRWRASFRKAYGRIGQLRAHLSQHVPFIACTATATVEDEAIIRDCLQFSDSAEVINLGNFRTNLFWEVRKMSGASKALHEVDFMIPAGTTSAEGIEQQLLFANKLPQTHELADRLRSRLPEELWHTVQVYHALRTPRQRAWIMYQYEIGAVRIIVCSEAIAMGCDFRNISRVVQFMLTDSLTTWIQRAGRGGRNPDIICRCILLVQPSVFQLVAPRNKKKKKSKRGDTAAAGTNSIAAILFGLAPLEPEPDAEASLDNEASDDEPDDHVIEVEVDDDDDDNNNGGGGGGDGDTTDTGGERVDGPQDDAVRAAETTGVSTMAAARVTTPAPNQVRAKATTKKKKKTVQRVYGKKVAPDLRDFVSTKDCRGAVIDKTYNNPPHESAKSGCCDVCQSKQAKATTTVDATQPTTQPDSPDSPQAEDPEAEPSNERERRVPERRKDALESAHAQLRRWRYRTWMRDWADFAFDVESVLTDAELLKVAKRRDITDTAALLRLLPDWALADDYKDDLLAAILAISAVEDEAKRVALAEKEACRRREQHAREQERRRLDEERQAVREAEREKRQAESEARKREAEEKKQAERDALRAAGKPVRGRPTRIELERRRSGAPALQSSPAQVGALQLPVPVGPNRGVGLGEGVHSDNNNTIPATPRPQRPSAHGKNVPLQNTSTPPSFPAHWQNLPWLQSPLATPPPPIRQVLGDVNGRKRGIGSQDGDMPGKPADKRARTNVDSENHRP